MHPFYETGINNAFILPSPRILRFRWGSVVVEQIDQYTGTRKTETVKYKDAKLWPGGSEAWDWKEHGTYVYHYANFASNN